MLLCSLFALFRFFSLLCSAVLLRSVVTHFTDLGCGSGKLVLQTAWLCPWIESLSGYEVLPELCELSRGAWIRADGIQPTAEDEAFQSAIEAFRTKYELNHALGPSAALSERAVVHAGDFLIRAADWLPKSNLLYCCATAFSETLRKQLFTLLVRGTTVSKDGAVARLQLPVGAIVVLVSYPIPASLNYSGCFVLLHTLQAAMSWGHSIVYVYRKTHARTAENNILRAFRK